MDSKTTIQCNKLMQLENSMLMYVVYSAETLEKLIDTVCQIHNDVVKCMQPNTPMQTKLS